MNSGGSRCSGAVIGEDDMSSEHVLLSALGSAEGALEWVVLGVKTLMEQVHGVVEEDHSAVSAFNILLVLFFWGRGLLFLHRADCGIISWWRVRLIAWAWSTDADGAGSLLGPQLYLFLFGDRRHRWDVMKRKWDAWDVDHPWDIFTKPSELVHLVEAHQQNVWAGHWEV